jgi:hypothetical protein
VTVGCLYGFWSSKLFKALDQTLEPFAHTVHAQMQHPTRSNSVPRNQRTETPSTTYLLSRTNENASAATSSFSTHTPHNSRHNTPNSDTEHTHKVCCETKPFWVVPCGGFIPMEWVDIQSTYSNITASANPRSKSDLLLPQLYDNWIIHYEYK